MLLLYTSPAAFKSKRLFLFPAPPYLYPFQIILWRFPGRLPTILSYLIIYFLSTFHILLQTLYV